MNYEIHETLFCRRIHLWHSVLVRIYHRRTLRRTGIQHLTSLTSLRNFPNGHCHASLLLKGLLKKLYKLNIYILYPPHKFSDGKLKVHSIFVYLHNQHYSAFTDKRRIDRGTENTKSKFSKAFPRESWLLLFS